MQEVAATAHRVAAAAGSILDSEAALITALRDAATGPPIPKSCPGCQKTNGARCGHHAGSTDVAETYHELGHALSGPSYIAPKTTPTRGRRLDVSGHPHRR